MIQVKLWRGARNHSVVKASLSSRHSLNKKSIKEEQGGELC
jgi:hypothetical protein